jgi:hypothetical protein
MPILSDGTANKNDTNTVLPTLPTGNTTGFIPAQISDSQCDNIISGQHTSSDEVHTQSHAAVPWTGPNQRQRYENKQQQETANKQYLKLCKRTSNKTPETVKFCHHHKQS